MKVKIEMVLDIKNEGFEEIKKLEHHIDYLCDLNSYPEINSVSDVSVRELD